VTEHNKLPRLLKGLYHRTRVQYVRLYGTKGRRRRRRLIVKLTYDPRPDLWLEVGKGVWSFVGPALPRP
jgi:hypothetical protein